MSRRRWMILLLGPIPIVFCSVSLSQWMRPAPAAPLPRNQAILSAYGLAPGVPPARQSQRVAAGQPHETLKLLINTPVDDPSETHTQLNADCRETAARLRAVLGPAECALAVYPPFVIAGDLQEAELDRWYVQTIGPAVRAMARSYFRTSPDQPITVLLFACEESYSRYALRLYGDEGVSVYGYYKPQQRALVMNIGTGGGTLVHELTHALIAFDFPNVPDWFNEGLASLHEHCRFRSDESGIDGLPNWRLPPLTQAIRAGKLRSLESLLRDDNFRTGSVGLNYAHARYFCMFMQERGVLEHFYRRFRAGHKSDPAGTAAVEHVFPELSWEQLDAEFQSWAAELQRDEE